MDRLAAGIEQYHPPKVSNWQLKAGLVIVAVIIILAFIGPIIAPRDPLQENFVVFPPSGGFVRPPFPAFQVPGFLLGADQFGRDIFSRLLWSIRPTLILVFVVAALRLIIGTVIGLAAGWSSKRNNLLNPLISLSLSVPVLFVALCFIAASGFRMGIAAFIIGLLLTGWGDVARTIRQQTKTIKSQLFIEASHALGASGPQNIVNHVIPQTIPLIWMMLAFEVSNTLLTTAQLGVLGFFINLIWIAVGDWVGMRASGMPELGQMLGTIATQPWGALAAGIIIFFTILGFNFLGEGLRIQSSPEARSQHKKSNLEEWAGYKLEQVLDPLSPLRRQAPTYLAVLFLVFIITFGGYSLWQSQNIPKVSQTIQIPGDHLWASANHDAQSTLFMPASLPKNPQITWTFDAGAPISENPVVDRDGNIYVATLENKLKAISPAGELIWAVDLPEVPVGSPAIGVTGAIYVTDESGGLTAIKPDKKVVQLYKNNGSERALSGPVVSNNETIYYLCENDLIAVASTGNLVWKAPLPTYSITNTTLRLTPDYEYLIYDDLVINVVDGTVVADPTSNPLDQLFVGTDGKVYLNEQADMKQITISPNKLQVDRTIKWDNRAIGTDFRFSNASGMTPDGNIWMFYGSSFIGGKILWLDPNGNLLSSVDFPFEGELTHLIGIDQNNTAVVCGNGNVFENPGSDCRGLQSNSSTPQWKIFIEESNIFGGALVPNRIYLAGIEGKLYALEDKK